MTTLERIAAIAPRMPGRERHNLACQLGREAVLPAPWAAVDGRLGASGGGASWPVGGEHPDVPVDGPAGVRRADPGAREIRVALTAASADQLAERARHAAGLVDVARGGPLVSEAGVHVSCGAGGRVVLVFPGWAADSGIATPRAEAATLARSLSVLQWLDELGVQADAAVGHGLGELAGLVWAGSLSAAEAARLAARQGEVRRGLAARRGAMARLTADEATAQALSEACGLVIAAYEGPRSHVLAGPAAGLRKLARQAPAGLSVSVVEAAHALHTPAMAPGTAAWRSVLARVRFGPPRRRLVSTVTACELTPQDDLAALLCAQLTSPVHFGEALRLASDGADLIIVSAGDATLMAAASARGRPVLSAGPQVRAWPVGAPPAVWGEDEATSLAALFAAGALPGTVLQGPGDAEPVDIWQDRPVSRPQPVVAPPPAPAPAPHRFVESIMAHRPGAGLEAEARISVRTDPYLTDYVIDGQAVLPAAISLEAMAQAASVLARRPMRSARRVSLGVPLVIADAATADGQVILRVQARVRGNGVETILRAGTGGQTAECARAVFVGSGPGAAGTTRETAPAGQEGAGLKEAGQDAAGSGFSLNAGPEIVDGADLYGSVCFQTGRFRRVALVSGKPPRSCRAIVRGRDEEPWFGPLAMPPRPLVLGSPGLNDAVLQVAQACVPDRRLRPAGCDSLTVGGDQLPSAVELRVFLIGTPDGEYVWDIHGYDLAGQPVLAWIGLQMRDAGPASASGPAEADKDAGKDAGQDPGLFAPDLEPAGISA